MDKQSLKGEINHLLQKLLDKKKELLQCKEMDFYRMIRSSKKREDANAAEKAHILAMMEDKFPKDVMKLVHKFVKEEDEAIEAEYMRRIDAINMPENYKQMWKDAKGIGEDNEDDFEEDDFTRKMRELDVRFDELISGMESYNARMGKLVFPKENFYYKFFSYLFRYSRMVNSRNGQ